MLTGNRWSVWIEAKKYANVSGTDDVSAFPSAADQAMTHAI